MATWREIATDNYAAVLELLSGRRWRSAVSRCYYAVYARSIAGMKAGAVFPTGREGPRHAVLPAMVASGSLGDVPGAVRLAGNIRKLYKLRLISDYSQSFPVDDGDARKAVQLMQTFFGLMEK